jgi:AbrB family looped-hinge helix DNA binding protein
MSTRVTVKGQVTMPKAVREAAGLHPGDRVTVRVRPEGGVIVERETPSNEEAPFRVYWEREDSTADLDWRRAEHVRLPSSA